MHYFKAGATEQVVHRPPLNHIQRLRRSTGLGVPVATPGLTRYRVITVLTLTSFYNRHMPRLLDMDPTLGTGWRALWMAPKNLPRSSSSSYAPLTTDSSVSSRKCPSTLTTQTPRCIEQCVNRCQPVRERSRLTVQVTVG